MFLSKLDISKKEMNILAIATGILIIGILSVISLMRPMLSDGSDNLKLWGYSYSINETHVYVAAPIDEEPFEAEVTADNKNDVYSLRKIMNNAYNLWQRVLRNLLILGYIIVFYFIMRKKDGSQFQTSFRGFLLGCGVVLLIFTAQLTFDVHSYLIAFGHDFMHIVSIL